MDLPELARVAPTLSSTALRALIMIAAGGAAGGIRKMARQIGVSASALQQATSELERRGLIQIERGDRISKNRYLVVPVSIFGTHQEISGPGVPLNGTPPVPKIDTPPTPNQELTDSGKFSACSIDVSSSINSVIDRGRESARSIEETLPEKAIEEARAALYAYAKRWADRPPAGPPDITITRRFLAVAPWPKLYELLKTLWRQEVGCGGQYSWFVTVAVQRIHGISPEEQRRRAAARKGQRMPAAFAPAVNVAAIARARSMP